KDLLKNEILISTTSVDEATIEIGNSKIGGRPDLPQDLGWFKDSNGNSLSFLAQINFAETKAFDAANELPATGIIYFFYSVQQEYLGFDNNDKDKIKVFFYDEDKSLLKRVEVPNDLDIN